ncbi:MAG TPA: SDR family oxidoreductase [Candidatus Woesebacteria bacterium]|nr:SDR family oxidoreductase [Candidatus Woesebacteria bacterium]
MNNTKKPSIIGTGLNGLVGSKIVKDLSAVLQFENIDISDKTNPVDITNIQQVESFIGNSAASVVLHCAAFTNVTAAWEQTGNKSGLAYAINVVGTRNIVNACKKYSKFLIHLSTAYVFDGTKDELYTEFDTPHPIEWYGQTKLWAEEEVTNSIDQAAILRIDQPFRSDSYPRADILHRILNQLTDDSLPPQFTDHSFGPTYIDDLAKTILWFTQTKTAGIFHATNGERWNDYDFARKVAEAAQLSTIVKPGSLAKYLTTSKRPYQKNTALDTTKLLQVIPHKPTPISVAIREACTYFESNESK